MDMVAKKTGVFDLFDLEGSVSTITGRHPQFPKNLAGQKVTFKVSPTFTSTYYMRLIITT